MKRYSPTHEWFDEEDNSVGISDHAVRELGDIILAVARGREHPLRVVSLPFVPHRYRRRPR